MAPKSWYDRKVRGNAEILEQRAERARANRRLAKVKQAERAAFFAIPAIKMTRHGRAPLGRQ